MSALERTRWALPLLAFVLGLVATLGLWANDIGRWWTLRAATDEAAAALAPEPAPAAPAMNRAVVDVAGQALPDALAWLPALQARSLRVQTLQTLQTPQTSPQAATAAGAAALRLSLTAQGAWHDWLALERQGLAGLAGWVPQSWQVQALGPPAAAGQVQLQWQLQWIGVPGANPTPATEALVPAPAGRPGEDAALRAEVFVPASVISDAGASPDRAGRGPSRSQRASADSGLDAAGGASAASAAAVAGAAGAGTWHLLGVWQQAGVSHAIAASGGRLHTLRAGQRLGQGAARVQGIEDARVWLGEGADTRRLRPWLLGSAP